MTIQQKPAPRSAAGASSQCPHFEFVASVKVARIEDTGMKFADLTIKCAHCGAPAVFRGMPMGLLQDAPAMAPDGQEARLPFICAGDPGEPKRSIGFRIRNSP